MQCLYLKKQQHHFYNVYTKTSELFLNNDIMDKKNCTILSQVPEE